MEKEGRTYFFNHISVYVCQTADGLYRAHSPGDRILHRLDVDAKGDIVDAGVGSLHGEIGPDPDLTASVELHSYMLEAISRFMSESE